MDPAEDSFEVSPMNSKKYDNDDEKEEQKDEAKAGDDRMVSKKATENMTISGVSEFDYLGNSDQSKENQDEKDSDFDRENEGKDSTKKSLEKDFEEAEQAEQAEQE